MDESSAIRPRRVLFSIWGIYDVCVLQVKLLRGGKTRTQWTHTQVYTYISVYIGNVRMQGWQSRY